MKAKGFIKVHLHDGSHIYINIDDIANFEKGVVGLRTKFLTGNNVLIVKESDEQIINLINEARI